MKTLKDQFCTIVSVGSALLVTLLLSLIFKMDGLQTIFTLCFAFLFVSLPVLFVWLYVEDKRDSKKYSN